jgi:hypothetical protein
MGGLEGCSRLACLDGIACSGLIAGGLSALLLEGRGDEAGLALAVARRFLPRSASSLVALDFRCAAPRAVAGPQGGPVAGCGGHYCGPQPGRCALRESLLLLGPRGHRHRGFGPRLRVMVMS